MVSPIYEKLYNYDINKITKIVTYEKLVRLKRLKINNVKLKPLLQYLEDDKLSNYHKNCIVKIIITLIIGLNTYYFDIDMLYKLQELLDEISISIDNNTYLVMSNLFYDIYKFSYINNTCNDSSLTPKYL